MVVGSAVAVDRLSFEEEGQVVVWEDFNPTTDDGRYKCIAVQASVGHIADTVIDVQGYCAYAPTYFEKGYSFRCR